MIRIRRAGKDDWARLFCWRNTETSPDAFFSDGKVSLGDHLKWLDGAVGDPTRTIYIAYDDGALGAVGVVRVDEVKPKKKVEGFVAEVSVLVEDRRRGQGYATLIVAKTIATLEMSHGAFTLFAHVKPTNYASLRLFADLHFIVQEHDDKRVVMRYDFPKKS